ncbi:PQQ-binding-like beta-propeller repeat protein [Dactylosporangium sp. CS-047395]|uniref:outer membrane protein assembly factor BamB family protein n=1 Tax=Dactylosporangium sp. CS-047395 TaxID=3239936 RepID=UPI003D91A2EF
MRPYAAAGLLVVPAAVLTASVAAHPEPPIQPSFDTPAATAAGLRPGDVVRGAAFATKAGDLVGYDPTADILITQADAGTQLTGVDAHTGIVRWRRQLDGSAEFGTVLWSQSDLGAGSVLVNTYRRDTKKAELTALSTRTGAVRWRMPLTARSEAMAAGPALLVGEPAEDSSPMQWADQREAPKAAKSGNARNAGRAEKGKATPSASWGPHAARSPGATPKATSGAAHKMRPAGPTPTPSASPSPSASATPSVSAKADERGSGRSRLGHTDEDAATVATRDAPGAGTINAVAAGDGGRLWSAQLPEDCDLRATAGDGQTTALRLACTEDDRFVDHLEIRDARTGALRSRTTLDPNADDGGLGLLVRDGATLVRGARTFQVYGPDGRQLAQRAGDGCAEYCDLAVEGDVAIVAQSGGSVDRTDGALEAFGLADGRERWRAERTVRALVREGGRLYAVGPAPRPVPFTAVSGVGEHGVSDPFATTLPADAVPQRGSAVLVSEGDELAWYRIRPVDQPAGFLGGAVERPDPCAVLTAAEVARRLGKQRATAHRDDAATCTFTTVKDRDTLRVQVLWAGADEASAIRRYDIVKGDDVQRIGTVIVAARESSAPKASAPATPSAKASAKVQ